MKTTIILYFVIWAILMMMLSSCASIGDTCKQFGMTTEYVDVYTKKTTDDGLQVIKFRCVPKPRLK
jgi:hypothetical protein